MELSDSLKEKDKARNRIQKHTGKQTTNENRAKTEKDPCDT